MPYKKSLNLIGRLSLLGVLCWHAPCPVFSEDTSDHKLKAIRERVLTWFPEDTETLIAAQTFTLPAAADMNVKTWLFPTANPKTTEMLRAFALEELIGVQKGAYLNACAGQKVAVVLRGVRNYEVVTSFGGFRSEACGVLVFEQPVQDRVNDLAAKLKRDAKEMKQIGGHDVFVFPSTIAMEPWVKDATWQGTFLVVLDSHTLMFASSDRYLEEVLVRVDTKATRRAIIDNLPEWRHVDMESPSWLVRHISKQDSRSVIQGLTLTSTEQGFRVCYVPTEKAGHGVTTWVQSRWTIRPSQKLVEAEQQADGTVTISSSIQPSLIWPLLHLPGETGIEEKE